MAMRHGRVARTPVSGREPEALSIPAIVEPERVAPAGREAASRGEIEQLVESLFDSGFSYQQRQRFHRGVNRVLDWLETFAGENWQDRWLISGSNEKETAWLPAGLTTAQRNNFTLGNSTLIVLRVIRPSYRWLSSSRMLGAYENFRRHNQADVRRAREVGHLRRWLPGIRCRGAQCPHSHRHRHWQESAGAGPGRPRRLRPPHRRSKGGRIANGLPVAAIRGRARRAARNAAGGPQPRAEDRRRARRPIPDRRHGGPRRARALLHRALRRDGLRHTGQSCPTTRLPVLGRFRAPSSRDLLVEPARFGRGGVEEPTPHAVRWSSASRRAQCVVPRPVLLSGPSAVGVRGSGPVGGLVGALPGAGCRLARIYEDGAAAPSPHAGTHPHLGSRGPATRRRRRRRTGTGDTATHCRPRHATRRGIHRRGATLSPRGPTNQQLAAVRAVRRTDRRTRSTLRCRTARKQRLLDLRHHRGTTPHRRSDRGAVGAHPPELAPIPGSNRRNGAAAANQPVQDRPGTRHPGRSGTRGDPCPHHSTDQGRQRESAADQALRHLREGLRADAAAPVSTQHSSPVAGPEPRHGARIAGQPRRSSRDRRCRRQSAAVHSARFPASVLHRDRQRRPAHPHRRKGIGPLGLEHHSGLCRGLSGGGNLALPPVRRPTTNPPSQRRIPRTHRSGMERVPRSLQPAKGRARSLRPPLWDALPARTRMCPLPDAANVAEPGATPAGIEANTHERLNEARRMRWLGEVAALEESLRHIANKKQQAERLCQRAADGDAGVDALS